MQIIKKGPSIIITETLNIKEWAHLGMIQGPPDYESGDHSYIILTLCEYKMFKNS